jgi:hypothetical protein
MANRNTRRVGKPPAEAETTSDTLKKIQELIDRAWACNDEPVEKDGYAQVMRHQKVVEDAVAFDASLGEGLKVGRLVGWPEGDGKAWYFVTKIGEHICELEWMPGIDAWHSPIVQNGKALIEAVRAAVDGADAMRRIFSSKKPT